MRLNFLRLVLYLALTTLIGIQSAEVFAQAIFVKATYQTLSQQEVDVTFSQTVSTPNSTGWTVTVGGTPVSIISTTIFGGTAVRVKFDASSVAGHGASEVFVKPGEVVKVSYDGTGTLSSTGGVATFSDQTATNDWIFDCSSDVAFYQETDYASTDQCAPVVMNFHEWKYRFSLRYRNSSTWASGSNTRYRVNWGDGSGISILTPYQSDLSGTASTTFIDPTSLSGSPNVIMALRPTHTYPSANPTDCSFNVTLTPAVAGVATCPSAAKQTIFATYDTDNQNSGTLALPPPLVAGTDQVCKGTNVNMIFNDNTSLNCRSAIEGTVPNQAPRWVRFVYGSQDNGGVGNIPDIRVTLPASMGGATIPVTNNDATGSLIYPTGYYPTGVGGNNVPDGFGVIQIPFPVTAATGTTFMATITTSDPSKQVTNQKFWVRLEYWDVCNPYSGDPTSPAPVTSSSSVTIITNNLAPTVSPLIFCANQSDTNYSMTASSSGPSAAGTFKWYKEPALSTLYQTGGSFNPVSSNPNVSKSPTTATTTNFYVTETIGSGCVSPATTVPFTIDPQVVPGSILFSGSSPQCNGYDPPTIFGDGLSGGTAATKGDGVTYTYQWQDSPNNSTFTNIAGATGLNYDPPVLTATRYYRRVASSGPCASQNSNVITIQIDQVVSGGAIGSDQTICAGSAPASFTNTTSATGGNGTISYQWQSSTVSPITGPFTNIAGAISATYTSGILSQTTYFRRQASSGVCSSGNPDFSNVITVTVNQAVAGGTVSSDQILCSGSTPIPLTGVVAASGGDGTTFTYLWQQSTVSSTGPFSSASGTNNNGSVYTVPALTQTTYFRRQATSGVCTAGFSNVITITINPLPTASSPTGGGAVCSGNPAPDIVWTLTGTAPYTGTWTDGTSTFSFGAAGVSQTATELRVSSPNTLLAGTYKILTLSDANSCVATSIGGTATITIGGTAPSIDPGSALTLSSTCFNGASTIDPSLTISLDDAGSSNSGPFTLTYKIDGGSNKTKTFNTGPNGDPTSSIIFSDTELDSATPSPHVISLVSLLSPFGCQATLANTFNFTVNVLPAVPIGANDGIACSNPGTGVALSVTAPGGGLEIAWSNTSGVFTNAVPGSGSVGISPFNIFTPTSSATATFYAFTKNSVTGCYSSSSLPVTQTQDDKPANAVAGINQNICSSSSSVTLAATPATNSGIGTWTVPNKIAYYQNFENFSIGTTSSTASNGWTRDVSSANAFPLQGGTGYFEVKAGKRFEAQNTNGSLGGGAGNTAEVVWTSSSIDISAIPSVTASVDITNVSNDLDIGTDADYVKVSYVLNGGAETPFPTNGNLTGNFTSSTASVSGLTGSTLVILIRVSTNAGTETVAFDNIFVKDASASAITFSDPNSATSSIAGLPAPVPGGAPIASTLRWTVASARGVCATSFSDMNVTINPLPTSSDPAPQVCEDVAGGGSHAAIDLTNYNSTVTNASTVAWFTNAARTAAVGTPTSVTVNNSTAKIFYFKATSVASCDNVGTLTFTVNSLPQASNQNLSFCEDFPVGSNQHAGINLTTYENAITGGATNRTVAWYSDAGLLSSIATPTTYTLIGTQTVYAKVTNTLTNCVNTSTVSLTLNPLPKDNPITGNGTVCANSTTIQLYQVDPTKNPGSSYTWTVSAVPAGAAQVFGGGGTNSSNFFVLVKFPMSGTVTITMIETLNGCSGNTSPFTVNVNNAPSAISINGLTEVCTNQTGVVYTVPGANVSSTYTWTASGATFPGASSGVGLSTVTIDYGLAPSAVIGVTETSSTGCVGSPASINVNVNSRPAMTSVNASTTCSDVAPTLVFTSSLPSTYSWIVTSITGTLTGTAIGNTGTGNISTLITNKSGGVGFVTYDVTPKAIAAPNCAGTVQSVTLTINPVPVLVSPQTKTICSGQATSYEIQLTPSTLPTGTIFNWPDPDGAGPASAGVNVPASSSGTVHINDILTNTTSSTYTINYAVTPTSGLCVGIPVNVAIVVNPEPIIATGLDATACSDTAIGLVLSTGVGSAAATSYNIISKTVAVGLVDALSNKTLPATGVTSNYLSGDQYTNTTSGDLVVSYVVQAVSTITLSCAGAPKTIYITINPEPVLASNLDAIVCSSSSIGVHLNTSLSSVAADSYSIVGRTIAGGLVAGGSNKVVPSTQVAEDYIVSDKYTNLGSIALTVVYQVSAKSINQCVGNPPQPINITVLPEPVIATNLNRTVCSGLPIGLTLNTNGTSVAATNYTILARSIDAGLVPGVSNAGVPNGITPVTAGYLSNDVYKNSTASPLFVTYTVAGNSTSCSGAPQIITITINPEPVMSPSLDGTVCSDLATGLVLNTDGLSTTASKYNIIGRVISGGLVANVGNAGVPASLKNTNYLINDIFTNTSSNPLDVTYTIIPVSSSSCEGASKNITFTINPEPVLSSSLDASICSIDPINLILNTDGSSVAAATYNITSLSVPAGLTASPGNALVPALGKLSDYLVNDLYSNTGASNLSVKYTVEPVSAGSPGCKGDPKVVTITMNAQPVMSNSLDIEICSNLSIGLVLNTNGISTGAANYDVLSVSIPPTLIAGSTNATVPASSKTALYLEKDKYINKGSIPLVVSYNVVPNSAANCSGTPKTINVTIDPEPVILGTLDELVCSNTAIGLVLKTDATSVTASKFDITSRSIAGGLAPSSGNSNVPSFGIASASYLSNDKFTNTNSSSLDVTYVVQGYGSINNCVGSPVIVKITIDPEPVVSNSLDRIICSREPTNLILNTNGTSATAAKYQVVSSSVAPGLIADMSNAQVPTATSDVAPDYFINDKFVNTTNSVLSVLYTVAPVSSDNCFGAIKTITIKVNPEPVIANGLDNQVCSDNAIGLVLSTDGSSIAATNYNIMSRLVDSGLISAGTNPQVPFNNATATYLVADKFTNKTTGPLDVNYVIVPVTVTGTGTCFGQPKTITIAINPEPILASGLDILTCSDNAIGLILSSDPSSVSVDSYNITSRIIDSGLTGAIGNMVVPISKTTPSYLSGDQYNNVTPISHLVTYSVVPVSGDCTGDQKDIIVTVKPKPVIAPNLDAEVCSGAPIGLIFSNIATGINADSYNVTSIIVAPGLIADGGNKIVKDGQPANYVSGDKFLNTSNTILTVVYTVVPVSNGCLGDPKAITIKIDPQPVVASTLDKFVCSSLPIGLVLNTNGISIGATSYKILSRTIASGLNGDLSNVAVPRNGETANYLINDKFTNVTANPLTVIYQVVASNGMCDGAPQSITITIDPEPVMASNLDQTVCSDVQGGIVLNTNGISVGASNYDILSVTIPVGLSIVSVANVPQNGQSASYLLNDTYNNKGNSPLVVSYTIVPVSADGCKGKQVVVNQIINPEPVLANLNSMACSDLPIGLTLATNGSSVSADNYTINSVLIDGGLTAAITNAVIPATSTSNYLFNDKFTNVTTGPLNVTYYVTSASIVSALNCSGDASPVVISINPKPVLSPTLDKIVCSRDNSGIILNTNGSSVTATFYNITSIVVDSGLVPTTGNATTKNNVNSSYLSTDKFTNATSANLIVRYTVVPVSAAGCLGDPMDVVLTVRPEPTMDPALASKSRCSRDNSSIILNTNGISVGAINYDVMLISKDPALIGTPTVGTGLSATAIQNDNYANTGAVPLNVIYSVTPKSAFCVGQPFTITLTVNPEPVISPGLDNTVCSKEISGITLSTNGSVGAASYKLISVTVPGTIAADAGNVPVNAVGGVSLIKGDKYVNTSSLPVTVVYTISGISAANCQGQPASINLIVNPEPILSPGFVSVCSGVASGVILGPAVGSAPIDQYDLRKILIPPSITASGTNVGLGTYSTTNFLASDKFTNTTSSPVIVTYTIAPIAPAPSSCKGNEQTVQLTINPAPALATGLSRIICSGSTSGIVLATASTSILAKNYNITSVTIGSGLVQVSGGTGPRVGINPTEIISDSFTNSTTTVKKVTYTIVPVSAAGCLGPATDVTLTIEPKIVVGPTNSKPDICSNDLTSIVLTSSSQPSVGDITYNYSASSSIGGQITGFVSSASNLPPSTQITDRLVNSSNNPAIVTYSITPVASAARGGSGCSGTPVIVNVKVEPIPTVVASPSIQTVCEGSASNIKLTTATVPTSGTVKFTVINVSASSGLLLTSPPIAKTIYSNNETIADAWSNSTTSVQTVTYTLEPAVSGGLGCVGNRITVTLNVNPQPIVTATSQVPICSNDLVNITLSADVSSTINTWTASVISGTASGFSASGAGDLIFQTIRNTGSIPAVVRYSITPKANNCVGPTITTDVQVDPIPDIAGVPSSINVCYGDALNIPLSSAVASTSFSWTVDPTPNFESVPSTGSGLVINQVMNNTSTSADYLSYSITATGPGATACQSPPKSMTVVAAPQMSAAIENPDTWMCSGGTDFIVVDLNGQAPFKFSYSDGTTVTNLTKVGNVSVIKIQPTTTTVYKLISLTDVFNCTIPLTNQVTFTVGGTDASFSVVTPLEHCNPYTPVFEYNQVAGTQYNWRWGDGIPDSTYIATTSVANMQVKHLFENQSFTQTLKPKVTLESSLPSPYPDPGCKKSSTIQLNIYPQLKTLISQSKTEMCSGETVSFTNQTAGATTNTWYYRELGNSGQQLEPKSTRFVSYTMTNTTTQNPITYEVYYKADNALCPADTTLQVKVYRSITAGFDEGTVPPFIGGNSTVTFTNTSTPIDISQFRYDWDFGTDSNPNTISGAGPFPVNFSSPGPRDVVLTATNISAEAAGLSCYSTFMKTINIQLLPLVADFDAEPKAACYPGDIKVNINNSTGDVFNWKVVDNNGSVVATSNAPLPVFRISAPGKFSIILVTSSASTGQQATKTLNGFEMYDLPVAAFIGRPSTVYVPDTEISTTNSSIYSTSWIWDFGDGPPETTYEAKHTYINPGIYEIKLIAMDDHGSGIVCSDTATQKVIAKQGGQTKIPNAFTPNPNGPSGGSTSGGSTGGSTLNDVFLPIVKGVEEFNMQIYDRWGNLIFESNSQNIGWDGYDQNGRLLPAGVYVYKLTLRLSNDQRTTQIGDLTMIR